MDLSKENQSSRLTFVLISLFVLLFVSASIFMNLNNPPWGDEGFHTGTANGLLRVHDFYLAVDPKEPITKDSMYYVRGRVVSLLTYACFKVFGMDIFYPRLLVLLASLMTLLIYLFYVRKKFSASNSELVLSSVLYLGSGFVLEDSIYLRFYTYYNLFFLCAFILLWESYEEYLKSKKIKWNFISLASFILIIPTVDDWQKLHFAYVVVAFFILNSRYYHQKLIDFCKSRYSLILLALVLGVWFLPLVPKVIDKILMKTVKIGNRPYAGYYHDYWDNIWGLTRFVFTSNFLIWIFVNYVKVEKTKWNFQQLLFTSGFITAILIGLFTPHNHIFYSRYFLLSMVAMTLGGGHLLCQSQYNSSRTKFLVIYLILNLTYSWFNFTYDKSGVNQAFDWLKSHPEIPKASIISDYRYYWYQKYDETGIVQIKDTSDVKEVEKLKDTVSQSPYEEFYFVYVNEYELKEKLYHAVTGKDRVPWVTLSRHIYQTVPHQKILDIKSGGLIKFTKSDLLKRLNEFGDYHYEGPEPLVKTIKNKIKKWFLENV